jgi:hypothetical protein
MVADFAAFTTPGGETARLGLRSRQLEVGFSIISPVSAAAAWLAWSPAAAFLLIDCASCADSNDRQG